MGAPTVVTTPLVRPLSGVADRRLYRWLGAASLNWALILAAFVAVASFDGAALGVVVPIALVVIGTRQHALALLTHEGAHYLCSRNKALNDLLATLLCAYPLGASLRAYRKFHLAHHRHVGTADDPESDYKGGMGTRWRLPLTRRRLVSRALMDCVGLGAPDVLQTFKTLRPRELDDAVAYLGFWLATGAALAFAGLAWCIVLWLAASATTQWAAFRVRIWTEHAGLSAGETHRFHANWWQRWLFFPTNTWCHYEHHAHAATPFYLLPKLRRELRAEPVLTVGQVFDKLSRTSVATEA